MEFEDWCGPFTRELDTYLKDEYKKIDCHVSYFMVYKNENTGEYEDDPCFRVPGYTVGWVVMDHTNRIIKEVHFNNIRGDIHQFTISSSQLEKIFQKYVGTKLELDDKWI